MTESLNLELLDQPEHLRTPDHDAVDRLIALQRQVFEADTSETSRKRVGEIYVEMASIESATSNFGEAAAYGFDAVEAFERAGDFENAVAGWCIVAAARGRLNMPVEAYNALARGIHLQQSIIHSYLERANQVSNHDIITRHTPYVPPEPPLTPLRGLSDEQRLAQVSARVNYHIHSQGAAGFNDWLREAGPERVAEQLRLYEVAKATFGYLHVMAEIVQKFLQETPLPKQLHASVLADLDSMYQAGPYDDSIRVIQTAPLLANMYLAFAHQPALKRKYRKFAEQRAEDLRGAARFYGSITQYGGFRSQPEPISSVASAVQGYLRWTTKRPTPDYKF
jgi:hypothetical protein